MDATRLVENLAEGLARDTLTSTFAMLWATYESVMAGL